VHGLRHTFATELANAGVSVYALMKLLATSPWLLHSGTSRPQERKPHGRSPEQDLQLPRSVVTGGAAHPILLRQVQFNRAFISYEVVSVFYCSTMYFG
jgi:hypothetical protein